jgi:ATP-dependent Clp protease ATP-binding subunit ClpA
VFERFTDKARRVVVGAQEAARARSADMIRTEHLLAALYTVPDNLALGVLDGFSVDREVVLGEIDRLSSGDQPRIDAEALSTLGIDLDEVRRQAEEAFGTGALDRTRAALGGIGRRRLFGHIPVDRTAKKALELALREALRLKHNYIGTEHILLGLVHAEAGAAHHILAAQGVRLEPARIIVEELVRGRKAG